MTQVDKDELEAIIDQNTLADVVFSLGEICWEKSEHIKESYGNGDADRWVLAADQLDDLAVDIEV